MSLGEEEAVEVFKFLGPKEAQKLGAAMAGLNNVTREEVEEVLNEFRTKAEQRTTLGTASDEYIRSVLTKALGSDKAANLLDRILQGGDTSGIEGLKWMDATSVAELIKNEHPQIIATILVHLDREQASEVLGHFVERLRSDVILRIATMEGVQPAALRELNDVLTKLLSGGDKIKKSAMGGVRAAAEILNFLGAANETTVIAAVRDHDPDLAQKIQDEMFVFDNLNELDDRSIQLLLREVQSESLIIALKGTTPELREKVFKNMSQRAAEMLRDDLEAKGPVRLSEVEAEQKEILKIVRKLADEGQIVLGGKGEEGFVE
jgi:flagellar motor switch protein FliG